MLNNISTHNLNTQSFKGKREPNNADTRINQTRLDQETSAAQVEQDYNQRMEERASQGKKTKPMPSFCGKEPNNADARINQTRLDQETSAAQVEQDYNQRMEERAAQGKKTRPLPSFCGGKLNLMG